MRTAALFIDAGYLFSAGSDLLFGRVHRRRDLGLTDPEVLLGRLADLARTSSEAPDLRMLRTYWYDGAPNGLPSAEQVAVGELPRVKLRLGRLNAGGQKGVDGLIILDLITLATNRAIDTAIVLSGDEDLREAALHAQGFGVSVVLLGMPPTERQRQSELLVREADHHVLLGRAMVADHLRLAAEVAVAGPAPVGTADDPAEDETWARLLKVAEDLVADPRFAGPAGVLSPHDPTRLDRRADRVLVARLADLTGVFPVEKHLLERARRVCVEVALRPAGG